MRKSGTTDLQLRRVPRALVEKLRARAQKQGKTMSQYAIEAFERELSKPSLQEWLDDIEKHPIRSKPGISASQAVLDAREERAEHLARLIGGKRRKASA